MANNERHCLSIDYKREPLFSLLHSKKKVNCVLELHSNLVNKEVETAKNWVEKSAKPFFLKCVYIFGCELWENNNDQKLNRNVFLIYWFRRESLRSRVDWAAEIETEIVEISLNNKKKTWNFVRGKSEFKHFWIMRMAFLWILKVINNQIN